MIFNNFFHSILGDIISAMGTLVCDDNNHSTELQYTSWSENTTPVSIPSEISLTNSANCVPKTNNMFCSQTPLTRHRFLAAPYSGTGYIPMVIRQQNQQINYDLLKNKTQVNRDTLSDKSSSSD